MKHSMTIVDCTLLAEVDIISASVVGLIALIVLVFAILSAKNWHWVNVVFLVLTLITSITAIIGMTQAFHHRRESMREFIRESDKAIKAEKEVIKIIGGDRLSPQYETGSLRDNNNRLSLALTGRGRAWRGGQVAVDGDIRRVTLKNERNLQEDSSLQGAILYAFAETGGIPNRYIGSVFVEEETEKDLTVKSVALADEGRFEEPTTTWTLFEKMPQDQRGIFKAALESSVANIEGERSPEAKRIEEFVKNMNDQSKEFDIAGFVQILQQDYLSAQTLGYDPDSLEYEQLVDRYAFDGQRISKIEQYVSSTPGRQNTLFEPTPQEVFIKFVFTADSDVAVQVDGGGSVENDGIFNSAGEAVVGPLRQNPAGVTFKKDDTVLIDEPSSAEFKNSHAGKLEQVDRIYVRQLQDFPMMFKNMKLRVAKFDEEIIIAQATIEKTKIALKDAREQINVRTDLLAKSTEDEERFTKDAEALRQSNTSKQLQSNELDQQIANLSVRIDSLYQQIQSRTLEKLRSAVSVR